MLNETTRLEEILGTYIEPEEGWESVFSRLSSTGAVDMKTLTRLIIYILERLDEYERHRKEDNDLRRDFRRENIGIQEGTGSVNEKVQPLLESSGTDSDSGQPEDSNPVI